MVILFISLGITNALAQKRPLKNNTAASQNTDFSQINVDELSDTDVANLQAQLLANGVTVDQAEQMAISRGMPQSQWDKLKKRFILPGATDQKNSTVPSIVPATKRQTESNDVSISPKSPSSNVFGSAFFNTESLSFEPNLRLATPVNYVLGPDDELLINVSGHQEMNLKTSVQPEGTIFIPQVGLISVNGLSIEAATDRIKDRMSQTAYPSLRNGLSKLIISLGNIRSIHIAIVGASKPGNYTISSLATVFNSLYLCGGPGDINTYRNIELIRNNKIYQTIDLYKFLTSGDQSGNISLRETDVINFPVYKKHVAITGQVKRPGVYELKDGETFEKLLFFAGGYTDKAYKASIKVKQITDTERRIKDLQKTETATYEPDNGDEFQVDSVLDRFENGVNIIGAVYRPGEFELLPNTTISSLIRRAGGLQENVFSDRAILTRTYPSGVKENIGFSVKNVMNGGPDDIPLIKRDMIVIAAANDFRSDYTVQIQGEVRKPGQYPFRENLSLKDFLFIAGGFTDAASSYHIEVGRRLIAERPEKATDSIAQVFNINVQKGFLIEDNKFILQPYDLVTVRRNPGYMEQQGVSIEGEVNYPGNYTIDSKKERISDLIKRAGGLTSSANVNGIFLIRKDTSHMRNEQSAKAIQNSVKDTSSKVIEDVTRTNNRIAINLEKVLHEPGSVYDYILQKDDDIQVQKTDPLVKISGEVLSSTKTGFVQDKGMAYYLAQAGGTTQNAKRSKIYVLYANGRISKTKNGIAGLFRSDPKIEAGAEIIVPKKIEHTGLSTTESIGILSTIVTVASLIIITISTLRK